MPEHSAATIARPEAENPAIRYVTKLIPTRDRANGASSMTVRRRTMAVFSLIWLIGIGLQFTGMGPGWNAFGLGLLLPGGGLLYAGHPILAVLALALFIFGFLVYWATGPVLLPPVIWLGAAGLAGYLAGSDAWDWAQYAVPGLLAAYVIRFRYKARKRFAREQRRGEALNEQLRDVTFPIATRALEFDPAESTEEDLEALRYLLDLALQPIESWDGFYKFDQFREAALRYQLNFIQYACAMSQYTRTPAFTGYLAEAQRNMIEKMLHPKVWWYWRLENAWGNLAWDPDPIIRDNVMISGYWGTMIGMYEALNEDRRYCEPGSLTFRNGDKEAYPYDFHSLSKVVHKNMMKSPYCLFPCEPGWVYPFCSSYAINTLMAHDQVHGTDYSRDALPHWERGFDEEFTTAAGETLLIKNGVWGFNMPSATTANASMVYWGNGAMPEITRRLWWTMRQRWLKRYGQLRNPDGGINIRVPKGEIDAGNYHFNNGLFARTLLQGAAREMGDNEVYDLIQEDIDRLTTSEVSDGRRRYPEMSIWANAQHALGRFGRENAMRDIIVFGKPKAWREGPLLSEAAYPDVLVARAVSDGRGLDLVLRPGNGPVSTTLGLSRLKPGQAYTIIGDPDAGFVADGDGAAQIALDLSGRHEMRIVPVE